MKTRIVLFFALIVSANVEAQFAGTPPGNIYYNTANVGIGTNNPDKTLTINGTIGFFRSIVSPTTTSAGFIKYENGFIFGNSSMADPLRFQTNSVDRLFIDNSGKIGVGTINPDNTLTLNGSIGFLRTGTNPTTTSAGFIKYDNGFIIGNSSMADPLRFQTNSIDRLYIDNGGNIGIGTTDPDAKLAVKGDIHTKEVRVDVTGAMAPDYVFEKDYNLISLPELETYLKQNKHLPEVPSAKEFEAEGMKLKEMNLLLLKKVEELTLYVIEQQKRIEKLEKLNSK